MFKRPVSASAEAWAAEYKRQGIPSSFRKDPSNALVEFISWLEKQASNEKQKAADLGCGLGRNSFYLASHGFSVTAIDLLQSNANAINEEASEKTSSSPMHGKNYTRKVLNVILQKCSL